MALNARELKLIQYLIGDAAGRLGRRPRTLALGYPDILMDQESLQRQQLQIDWTSIPKRPGSAQVWKTHGYARGDHSMLETKALLSAMGADPLVLDAVAHGGEDFIADLNYPLSIETLNRLGKFDLLIDPGTIEHCFNIVQALLTATDLLAPGGFSYHQGAIAYPNHGYWSISPAALFDFYSSRGFALNKAYCWAGHRDRDGLEPCFVPLLPFTTLPDIPSRVASFVFQLEAISATDKPLFPIQHSWVARQTMVRWGDIVGRALSLDRSESLAGLAVAFRQRGVPPNEADEKSRSLLAQLEGAGSTPDEFLNLILSIGSDIRLSVENVVKRPIEHLLIAPAARYVVEALPVFAEAFPRLTLADNFKAGNIYYGIHCRPFDEIIENLSVYDAVFIGSIDPMIAAWYEARLPADRIVSISALVTPRVWNIS